MCLSSGYWEAKRRDIVNLLTRWLDSKSWWFPEYTWNHEIDYKLETDYSLSHLSERIFHSAFYWAGQWCEMRKPSKRKAQSQKETRDFPQQGGLINNRNVSGLFRAVTGEFILFSTKQEHLLLLLHGMCICICIGRGKDNFHFSLDITRPRCKISKENCYGWKWSVGARF